MVHVSMEQWEVLLGFFCGPLGKRYGGSAVTVYQKITVYLGVPFLGNTLSA